MRTSSAHFWIASSVVTFSSEPIGARCSTFWNLSEGGPPTRRVGESSVASSGLLLLERLQLVEEAVVLGVRDLRVVEHVVAVVVVVELLPELRGRACAASQRAARSSSADATTASGSSASSRSRGWMPPQVTAIECMPAALGGADVERRVADVDRLVPAGVEQFERVLERRGIRLVPVGVVGADDDVEELLQRQVREGEPTVSRRFAVTTPRRRPSAFSVVSTSVIPAHSASSACSGSLCSR